MLKGSVSALEEVNQKQPAAEGETEFGSMSDHVTPLAEPAN